MCEQRADNIIAKRKFKDIKDTKRKNYKRIQNLKYGELFNIVVG